MSDAELLEQFVGSFEKLGDMIVFGPLPPELGGRTDISPYVDQKWKPVAMATDPAAMTTLYQKVPGPFPPLYEQLVLSYRWLQVDLDDFVTLLANPPGPTLQGLAEEITADPIFVDVLFPLGLIPFGRPSGGSYDPVCFDLHRRTGGDCPIVRIEHEAVLCDLRVGESWELAPSFRSLVEAVIAKAAGTEA